MTIAGWGICTNTFTAVANRMNLATLPATTPKAVPKRRPASAKRPTISPLPSAMKGIIGAKGAGKMPRAKATTGVHIPTATAYHGPSQRAAVKSAALTAGPVTGWGRPAI